MKRKAFTLIELMVVISIIVLLLSLLMPTIGRARAVARAAMCASNLHQLYQAFGVSYSVRVKSAKSTVAHWLPTSFDWPDTPMDVAPTPGIYQCPDDVLFPAECNLNKLQYVDPHSTVIDLNGPANDTYFKRRSGQDAQGRYVEWILEDDANDNIDWPPHWTDIDGYFRIYINSGKLCLWTCIPDSTVTNENTCGDYNRLKFNGDYLFNGDKISLHRNEEIKLPGWNGNTNYGMNSFCSTSDSPDVIMLVDYKQTIIEPDKGQETEDMLINSGRHLGQLNVLRTDGSVQRQYPLEISPKLMMTGWQ